MKTMFELDWVYLDNKKGAGIFTDDGIYFQPYEASAPAYPLGDSLAVQITGVAGAFNLYKKLSEEEEPPVIAQKIRNSVGLEELVKNNTVIYFPWVHVADVKKRFLTSTVIINMKDGRKLTLGNLQNKAVFEYISAKIAKNV